MTAKQQRFVEAYLGEGKFCATKAARIAGYSQKTASVIGCQLRKKLAAEIDARLEALTMSSGEVLTRLTEIARNEASQYVRIHKQGLLKGQPYLDTAALQKAGKAHLIKGIKPKECGVEVVLQDPQSALELLAKHHGLLTERHEVEMHDAGVADALDRKLAGLAAALGTKALPGEPVGQGEG